MSDTKSHSAPQTSTPLAFSRLKLRGNYFKYITSCILIVFPVSMFFAPTFLSLMGNCGNIYHSCFVFGSDVSFYNQVLPYFGGLMLPICLILAIFIAKSSDSGHSESLVQSSEKTSNPESMSRIEKQVKLSTNKGAYVALGLIVFTIVFPYIISELQKIPIFNNKIITDISVMLTMASTILVPIVFVASLISKKTNSNGTVLKNMGIATGIVILAIIATGFIFFIML